MSKKVLNHKKKINGKECLSKAKALSCNSECYVLCLHISRYVEKAQFYEKKENKSKTIHPSNSLEIFKLHIKLYTPSVEKIDWNS